MLFDVYRIMDGRGLVDDCGQVEAASLTEAEDVARLMYPCSPGEHLDILAADGSGESNQPDDEEDDSDPDLYCDQCSKAQRDDGSGLCSWRAVAETGSCDGRQHRRQPEPERPVAYDDGTVGV